MATYNRTDFIATFGNRPVAEGGRKVHSCEGAGCDGPINAYAGEILIYNPRTDLTIGKDEICSAEYIAMAVGCGKEGGLATDLLHIFGNQGDVEPCNLKLKATVKPPCCGVPQIVDVFFDCIKCDRVYTLEVLLDDSLVRSRYQTNEKAKYIFQAVTVCCDCKDCDPEANCDEVVCKLVDAINGTTQKDPTKVTRFVKANSLKSHYQPFSASRLFLQDKDGGDKTSHVFCLTLDDTDCKKCSVLTGITGFEVDGIAYPFEFTTLPDDTAVSYPSQIKRIVCLINDVLKEVGGSAKLQRGVGRCCPYSIEINTCGVAPKLLTAKGAVEPKISRHPFSSKQVEQICKGCGTTPDKIPFGCGLRLFVDPVEVPCHCAYPPHLASPNTYIRNIEVQFVGDGWVCNNFHSFTSQESERPEGFGYYWQDQAVHRQYKGGHGRNHSYSNRKRGKVVALPDENSNFTNAAKGWICEQTYCIYNLMHQKSKKGFFNNALTWTQCDIAYLGIPDCDKDTLASFVECLTELQKIGTCFPGNLICLKAADDTSEEPLVVAEAATIDVTENDPDFAAECDGTIEWDLGAVINADVVNNEDGTFAVTPKACGDVSFCYTVFCVNEKGQRVEVSSATFESTAEEAA